MAPLQNGFRDELDTLLERTGALSASSARRVAAGAASSSGDSSHSASGLSSPSNTLLRKGPFRLMFAARVRAALL